MLDFVRELRRRCILLGREESGVALMMTLSIFLLLYVACAGIYAIGETARQKIELQNACDSAAYSAAVVQADGLSRMAMINRALSWTYVQLTNVQLDYITFRWMKKARDNFLEDRRQCEEFNNGSMFICLCVPPCRADCREHYLGEGNGWFCGTAGAAGLLSQSGNISLNGKIYEFSQLNETVQQYESSGMEKQWGDQIKELKKAMDTYNFMLKATDSAMHEAMGQAVTMTLAANLQRLPVEDRADLLHWMWCPSPSSDLEGPYGENSGTYFRPLYNNEIGERIFLTMADGRVYETLGEYFPEYGEKDDIGGLDQWFIRSYAEESANGNVRSTDRSIDPDVPRSYADKGICRVYKNANRREGGEVHRGHHTGQLLLDTPPSCTNYRRNFPEQCDAVEGSVALCAEYEWSAVRMLTCCYMRKVAPYVWWPYHTQFGAVMRSCPHLCCSGAGQSKSHARDEYKGSCYRNETYYYPIQLLVAYRSRWTTHPHINMDLITKNPYGFARIYGDDQTIYDQETYTGMPAKPWILGPEFYVDGSTVVGLARRQRNPFAVLLDSMVGERKTDVVGIHSAFNPVVDGHIVAFSAARAAHHFNPSSFQKRTAPDLVGEWNLNKRDYETRYDAVCHDCYENDAGIFKFDIKAPNLNYGDFLRERLHVGCVCNSAKNLQRLARCWNLWEADWDATLLPLPYQDADAVDGKWYDSYEHSVGKTGNMTWEAIGRKEGHRSELNAFQWAHDESKEGSGWRRLFDESGNLLSTDDGTQIQGQGSSGFLEMRVPKGMENGADNPVFDLDRNMTIRIL